MKSKKRDGMLGSHPYFDIRHNYDDVSSKRRTHFIAKVFNSVEPECTSGYTTRTERTGHLKTSKDPIGNQTRNFPYCGAVPQPTSGRLGEWSVQNNLLFEELLKNFSLISGKGINNSVLHCGPLSPGHHQSSTSFSGLRSGTKREKRETKQLVSSSTEVKKPVLIYLFSIYILTPRCLCKHTA